MEFKLTEKGRSARLRDVRSDTVQTALIPGTGVRTVSTCMPIDDSSVPVLKCDIYHVSFNLTGHLEDFGKFLAEVLAAQPPVDTMSRRELVIAAWNNRSLGRWLC
jgi:hypothetical protein